MIKLWILFFGCILLSLHSFSAEIRTDFHNKMFTEQGLNEIIESNNYPNSSILQAYKGASYTMLADYAFLPTTKWDLFKTGRDMINLAVQKSPYTVELRYIRLLIQLNIPSFLGYNNNISSDLSYFSSHILQEKIEKIWKLKFIDNLMAADQIEDTQVKELKILKNKLK